MKLYRLQRTQIIPTSITGAWRFFSSPANLPLITPPSLGFRVTSPAPEAMYPGMIITYTVTPFPLLKFNWVTEITHVREPFFFVDEQRLGPYRFWHHQHHFEEVTGGVAMTDIVSYALPFGFLGRMVAGMVAGQLKDIFDFRQAYLRNKSWFD
jgi:ligand-binding SRPBCC domain-containing protein